MEPDNTNTKRTSAVSSSIGAPTTTLRPSRATHRRAVSVSERAVPPSPASSESASEAAAHDLATSAVVSLSPRGITGVVSTITRNENKPTTAASSALHAFEQLLDLRHHRQHDGVLFSFVKLAKLQAPEPASTDRATGSGPNSSSNSNSSNFKAPNIAPAKCGMLYMRKPTYSMLDKWRLRWFELRATGLFYYTDPPTAVALEQAQERSHSLMDAYGLFSTLREATSSFVDSIQRATNIEDKMQVFGPEASQLTMDRAEQRHDEAQQLHADQLSESGFTRLSNALGELFGRVAGDDKSLASSTSSTSSIKSILKSPRHSATKSKASSSSSNNKKAASSGESGRESTTPSFDASHTPTPNADVTPNLCDTASLGSSLESSLDLPDLNPQPLAEATTTLTTAPRVAVSPQDHQHQQQQQQQQATSDDPCWASSQVTGDRRTLSDTLALSDTALFPPDPTSNPDLVAVDLPEDALESSLPFGADDLDDNLSNTLNTNDNDDNDNDDDNGERISAADRSQSILHDGRIARGIFALKGCRIARHGTNPRRFVLFHPSYSPVKFECLNDIDREAWYEAILLSILYANAHDTHIQPRLSIQEMVLSRCSWCFQLCYHSLESSNILRRNVFQCTGCHSRTLPCTYFGCSAMTRGHTVWDDQFCAVHDGTILSWDAIPTDRDSMIVVARSIGWCSWCMSVSQHRMTTHNKVLRDSYRCTYCGHRTTPCKGCSQAFARSYRIFGELLCAKCDGKIKDWREDNSHAAVKVKLKAARLKPFVPERDNVNAKFLIDGEDVYYMMSKAIEAAQHEILMCFWMMCPVLNLRRDDPESADYRIDTLLLKKAREGVLIRIILWAETRILVNNFSTDAQVYLQSLHDNIRVIRHPHFAPMYYSHHQKTVIVDRAVAFVGGLDMTWGRYDNHEHLLIDPERRKWLGIDYYNPNVRSPAAFFRIDDPNRDGIDRSLVTRMPWHDVEVMVDSQAAIDVAANFVQRWNHHIQSEPLPPLDASTTFADVTGPALFHRLTRPEHHQGTLGEPEPEPEGTMHVQVLRSLSTWSGNTSTEASILGAYLKAIESAESFIYIENQFFISSTAGNGVVNGIANAIIKRIRHAIKANQRFHVVILFPQPEELGRWSLPILQREYRTIATGGNSILDQLSDEFPLVNLSHYFTCYQLRAWAVLKGKVVTDQIFIHSKIMLVDDRVAIVGSANINDRSFLGDRDSEIAVRIRDSEEVTTTFNQLSVTVGKFVHTMRLRLMNEHVGLPLDDMATLADPFSHSFKSNWHQVAQQNTAIFEEVFDHIASSRVKTWAAFRELTASPGEPKNPERLRLVKGHLCLHPLYFLSDEPPTYRESALDAQLYQ